MLQRPSCFSALQRAEIAEMIDLLRVMGVVLRFSALQRAEIAEMRYRTAVGVSGDAFQCSSTSRNC